MTRLSRLPIVTRSDGKPAWVDAPPRLRQSEVRRSIVPERPDGEPPLWAGVAWLAALAVVGAMLCAGVAL